MRIGLVCPYSLSVPGGVQAQVQGLARSMRQSGHEVRILAPCDGPPPDTGVTPLGASIPVAANGSVAPLAPDPAAAFRTIRALRDERFDVVHVHEPFAPGPAMTAMLVSDAPVVATFHQSGLKGLYEVFKPVVRMVARRRIAHAVAVSEAARSMVGVALGRPVEILWNGVEIEPYAKATPWPTTEPTVFFIGRHEERKGLPFLIDALPHLPVHYRFWIGGHGAQTEALRARAGGDDRVEWLGRISDDEKHQRMRGAGVFVAPNLRGESFGVILLEAMAAHTPVVATDIDGFRAVARDENEGLLVPPGDGAALAAAIQRVLDDGALAGRLVAAGDRRASEFSMERLADRYLELYADVAATRR